MGSPNCTIEEAASRLGKSRRMVYNYIEQGLLSRRVEEGHVVVDRADLEQLATDLASDAPVVNRKTVFQLTTRLNKLENEMQAVLHALDMRSKVMRPTAAEASGFYRAVKDSLTRRNAWQFEEVKLWTEQLQQMDELTLEVFVNTAMDPKAWVPFYELCQAMMEFSKKENSKKPDIEWQKLVVALDAARIRMRAAIIILIEMGKGVTPETVIGLAETPKDALLAKMKS